MSVSHARMCVLHMGAWCLLRAEAEGRGQKKKKKALDPLGLKLPKVVSYHVDAGYQTRVLCKSNNFSFPCSALTFLFTAIRNKLASFKTIYTRLKIWKKYSFQIWLFKKYFAFLSTSLRFYSIFKTLLTPIILCLLILTFYFYSSFSWQNLYIIPNLVSTLKPSWDSVKWSELADKNAKVHLEFQVNK